MQSQRPALALLAAYALHLTQTFHFLRASAGGARQVDVPRSVIGAEKKNGEQMESNAHVVKEKRIVADLMETAKDPDDRDKAHAEHGKRRVPEMKETAKDLGVSGLKMNGLLDHMHAGV